MNSNWFIEYCNMSKDEKELYKEFEMDDGNKMKLQTYKRLYDAVTLMSLDYKQQIATLPQGIPIPDEIALTFDDEAIAFMETLYKSNMLSTDDCVLIEKIDNKLLEIGEKQDEDMDTVCIRTF